MRSLTTSLQAVAREYGGCAEMVGAVANRPRVLLSIPATDEIKLEKSSEHPQSNVFDAADMDNFASAVHSRLERLVTTESYVQAGLQKWVTLDAKRDSVEAEIILAAIHLKAGEPDGAALTKRALADVAPLQSVRASAKLESDVATATIKRLQGEGPMTTSTVLGLIGGLLLLVALVGGGFSFSGTMMPAVGRAVRIPCFIMGCILVFSAIVLALREYPDPVSDGGGSPQTTTGAPTTFVGIVHFAGGEFAYVYQLPSLSAPRVGALANGTSITILCTTQGNAVLRADGVISSLWDRIDQGYIPDVNVYTGTDQPTVRNC